MGRQEYWFGNAFRLALETDHRALALVDGGARKYPRDVAPFAALADVSLDSLARLRSLMEPDEAVWLSSDGAGVPVEARLKAEEELTCLQMVFPADAPLPDRDQAVVLSPVRCDNRAAMVRLTDIAYPGFFREWTCRMGRYFGVWDGGELVAMGGERINFTIEGKRYREISGLCTHPDHRGRGYGSALLAYLLALHRSEVSTSWLHVSTKNPAQELYKKMGFVTANVVELRKMRRTGGRGVVDPDES